MQILPHGLDGHQVKEVVGSMQLQRIVLLTDRLQVSNMETLPHELCLIESTWPPLALYVGHTLGTPSLHHCLWRCQETFRMGGILIRLVSEVWNCADSWLHTACFPIQVRGGIRCASQVQDADAVLTTRDRLKGGDDALIVAARAAGQPIFSMKTSSQASMVKALRSLAGIDPSPLSLRDASAVVTTQQAAASSD